MKHNILTRLQEYNRDSIEQIAQYQQILNEEYRADQERELRAIEIAERRAALYQPRHQQCACAPHHTEQPDDTAAFDARITVSLFRTHFCYQCPALSRPNKTRRQAGRCRRSLYAKTTFRIRRGKAEYVQNPAAEDCRSEACCAFSSRLFKRGRSDADCCRPDASG